MYELIKTSLHSYIFLAVFVGLLFSLGIISLFKKTKNIESKTLKIFLCVGVSIVLVCIYLWFFIYTNLYPISLAYYEYTNNSIVERTGVLDSIAQKGKDRINIIIDSTEYTMVYSSQKPWLSIGSDVDEGDIVKFKFGEKSKFIFEINEEHENN